MNRIDALLVSYLTSSATPAEIAELQALLAESAAARRRLVEQSMLDACLQEVLRQAPRTAGGRRAIAPRTLVWPWVAAATGVVLFAIATSAALKSKPPAAPVVRHEQRVEETIKDLHRQEAEAEVERKKAETDREDGKLREWEETIRRIQAERAAKERELAEAKRPKVDPPTREPDPVPEPPAKTEPAVARLGERDLVAGAALDVDASAILEFPDGTRITLAAKTSIRALATAGFTLESGTLDAESRTKGFAVHTAHADVTIVGASLHLVVTPESTRLEVAKGTAKLTRGAKSVDVKAGTFAVATAKSLSAAQPIPTEDDLVLLDFEDEAKPAMVEAGSVEKGPSGRRCLAGIEDRGVTKVMISGGAKGLFTIRGGETLTFDYWVDSKARKVNFNVLNRTQGRRQDVIVPNLATGRWATATFKLSDFGANEGDTIVNIYLQGVGDSAPKFYIDNLRFSRPRKEK